MHSLISLRKVFFLSVLTACEKHPPAILDRARSTARSDIPAVSIAQRDTALGPLIGYRAGYDSSITLPLSPFSDSALPDTLFDASPANGTKVDLFGSTGLVGSAVIEGAGKSSDEDGCSSFPAGRVNPGYVGWDVALTSGRATGIPLLSLSELHGNDSLQLTEDLATLAASVPGAQDSLWRDQKFSVELGVQFSLADVNVVAGTTLRTLPGPPHYGERTFVVGERAHAKAERLDRKPALVLAYSHRTAAFGMSDEAESGLSFEDQPSVDAAVTTKSNARPTLLLETMGNEANGFAALGRIAPGRWRVIWNGGSEGGC